MNIQALIYLLSFTLAGCLLAANSAFNRLRKGYKDIVFYQVAFLVSGLVSVAILVAILKALAVKLYP